MDRCDAPSSIVQPRRLLLVDGHAYAYRAFYAIRGMRSPAGRPTGAVFGFVKMLAKLRAGFGGAGGGQRAEVGLRTSDLGLRASGAWVPSHVLVVWDGGLSAERRAAWPEYKAQRPEMPADLGAQLDEMVRYLAAAQVSSFCRAGVEADDYIACVARAAVGAGWEVVIASADKDFMQLVSRGEGEGEGGQRAEVGGQRSDFGLRTSDLGLRSPGSGGWIGLVNPNDKGERIWGAAEVRAKCGVAPEQAVDWLSLVGDAVDNIPGVPGVGAKTATGLLQGFGSVAEIYRRLAEVKSVRIRAALQAAEADVRRNQSLVRLKTDLECEFAPAAWAVRPADLGQLAGLYREWGFRSLLAEAEAEGMRSEVGGQRSEGGPRTSDLGLRASGGPVQGELI